jgi:hypothetical protein
VLKSKSFFCLLSFVCTEKKKQGFGDELPQKEVLRRSAGLFAVYAWLVVSDVSLRTSS